MSFPGRRVFRFIALFLTAVSICPCVAWAATATAIIPAAAPHGARVLVIGTGLDAPDIAVAFSGPGGGPLPAMIIAREPRLLDLVVPTGAATGPVFVTNGAGQVAALSLMLLP